MTRRLLGCALALAALGCGDARASHAQGDAAAGRAALRAGRYDEAVRLLSAAAERPGAPVDARRLHVRALAEVGRYADAETAARRYAGAPDGAELATAFGEVLAARGRLDEADAAFRRADRASDSLTARLNLAELRAARGDRAGADALFTAVAAAGQGGRGALTAEQRTAVGAAHEHLGAREPARFRDALRAYDAAIAADSADPEPRVRLGELFLAKYNGADAGTTFDAVLRRNPRHPRALLGAARVRQFDGRPGADSLVRQSLAVNPALPATHVLAATALLDAGDHAGAVASAGRALAVDSLAPDALAVLAAAHHLAGTARAAEDARRRALLRDPRNAEVDATLAELSARHRRYADAVAFAARGVALDPQSWRSHGLRGINQLRLGRPDSARASLEVAFRGDPYDVWVKNTLDLLDATRGYVTARTPRFVFLADSADAALLAPYLGELLEEAYDKLAARYAYRPPNPVRLEVYRRHADFSVRTVGLAGLGALGVSFGPVLAMDSPAARELGQFHWGSTAWHELAHTFTLGVTENRVPRWLSEGISVLEERRARPGWGDGPSPAFLRAYAAGRVPPPSRLDAGFTRPAFPEQVLFSYYAASLVCEMLEQADARALPNLLAAYRDGRSPEQAVRQVTGADPAALDRRFDAYVRQRFAGALAAVGAPNTPGAASPFARLLDEGRAHATAGRASDAARAFGRAKAMFPEYAAEDSPYWELARLAKARGDARGAAAELAELTRRNGGDYAAHVELAALLEPAGDRAGAAAALERAIYVSPYDVGVHQRLAALAAGLGDRRRAVRERRAVVALAPVDMPDALYQLARALHQAGDAAAARREVLRALELAPSFAPAQELLLELQPGGGRAG